MKEKSMIRCLVMIGLMVFSSAVMSSMYVYHPIGSSTVLGNYGNRHALSTASGNAAAPYLMANLQGFRVSFLGPIGIAFEGGVNSNDIEDKADEIEASLEQDFASRFNVENIQEDLEENLINSVEDSISDADVETIRSANSIESAVAEVEGLVSTDVFESAVASVDETLTSTVKDVVDGIETTVEGIDEIIEEVSESLYLKFSATTHVPFMPIIYKTRRRGVFMLDASASLVGRVGLLADTITINGLDDLKNITSLTQLDDFDADSISVETDTSLHIKRASDVRYGLGYSEMISRSQTSSLIVGGRLNYHRLALDQKLVVLTSEEDSSFSYGDFFINRDNVDSGFSLDLGVVLAGRNYQLGASVANVNEPTFDYKVLGDCTGLSGASLTSCNAAIRLAEKGKISLNETYKMEAQLTLDAAIKSKDQHFSLAGSYDVNPIEDPLGDEYQWSVASLSYFSDNFFFPGIRIGYRKNLVGSELDYITAGLTFYRRLDFDVAYAPENEIGNTGLSLSMGYSFVF